MERDEISWSLDSVYAGTDSAYYGFYLDGTLEGDWADFSTTGIFNTDLDKVATDSLSGYMEIDVTNKVVNDTTINSILAGYKNNKKQYGSKPNAGSNRSTITGNLTFDLGAIRLKVGGLMNQSAGRRYIHSYSLLNSDNNPKWETNTRSAYTNLAVALSDKSYIKVNASYFKYTDQEGDNTYFDQYNNYGNASDNFYLRDVGKNPTNMQPFANFAAFGAVWDDYDYNETSYTGLKTDFVNQMGNHEIKTGFDYRNNTIKYYRLAQPMEIAQEYHDKDQATITDQWIYEIYRNAYAENLGFTVDGKDDKNGIQHQEAGNPVVLGAYVQDKIELEDLIVNLGVRYDYFNPNTEAAEDWTDIYTTEGKIDRALSKFKKVDAYTYINPRIGFSFPVSDKTKIHAQYGKFTQHPILNRLYLSDTRLASNLTQGNMTVSPNPSLKPEQTTQYEVGLAQQIGGYAALGITGFYKEIRDYTMMANLKDSKVNGALFNWAQYVNGDYGVVKGMSLNLNMRRVNGLMANASYTLSFAEGTGSDPASNWNIAWTGDTYPTMINSLDYDQRHTGSVMLDYRFGDDGGLFANSGANLLFQFGSGTAYTPSLTESAVFGRGWYAPIAAVNSAYKPWTSTLDVRLDRGISLGGYDATVYVLVLNALDADNVDEVYPGSGDAGNDGYLNTLEGKTWVTGNPDAIDFYNARQQDPRNWDSPRQVRVGLTIGL
jgi:outer membrane receptor protein involved in Fe transport